MAFLRNIWCVAAWNHEVSADTLLTRRLLGKNILFYRDASGTVRALMDRCPHRFVPLSLGKINDGQIQCVYYGLVFNGAGVCVHNPHGDGAIPKAARVVSFPVVKKHSTIWIWMGEPEFGLLAA